MQSRPKDIYEQSDAAIGEILDMFLRAPGMNETLRKFLENTRAEILAILYDIWASAHMSENMANVLWIFTNSRNVNIGSTEDREGVPLFADDLQELCEAINTWLEAGALTPGQQEHVKRAVEYYSRFRDGINPGHISIMRGWLELGLVASGNKVVRRCADLNCGRLVITDKDGYLLAGTPEGYHSARCRDENLSAGEPKFQGMEAQIEMTPDGEAKVTAQPKVDNQT